MSEAPKYDGDAAASERECAPVLTCVVCGTTFPTMAASLAHRGQECRAHEPRCRRCKAPVSQHRAEGGRIVCPEAPR